MSKPIYCGNCRASNTWMHLPKQDIKDCDGKVLWERYQCTLCQATTLRFVSGGYDESVECALNNEFVKQDC